MATTDQLTTLAQDNNFRQRLRNLMLLEASVVIADTANANKTGRISFAIKLLTTPSLCDSYADWFCARTNLVGTAVTYDFAKRAAVTDATDAAIRSQINTDWNVLSGLIP